MLTSVRWLNDYLDPPLSAETQADCATRAGFPLEGRETIALPGGETDIRQDFEMTSNRGDCVSHVGLAREIAAINSGTLKLPHAEPPTVAQEASTLIKVTNHAPERCPLYTARVIRGATVRPSPAWLANRLMARGDIPRNNIVDATNFVLFELGQPTHVFDLATLEGGEIIIRMARQDEPFLPLGEGESEIELDTQDLVIADRERAVALAGVKGGGLTAVTERTTDLLLEAATFDPVSVRNTSRRHGIASASSYRFERGVHAAQIEAATNRLSALILELAGGELCTGIVSDGVDVPGRRTVTMRAERCRKILGVPIEDREMLAALARLGFEPTMTQGTIDCIVPVTRLDVEREIELIEEVGRMYGLDRIPVHDTMEIQVTAPQPTEQARQAVANELAGMGFVETVTHALIAEDEARPFLPEGATPLHVEDDRAKARPILQPSVLPGLLTVRQRNADNGVDASAFFELASTFWCTGDGHEEVVRLGLVLDVEDEADGLRPLRGVIERVIQVLGGPGAAVATAVDPETRWLEPGAKAVTNGACFGRFGRLAPSVARVFGLDATPLVAELELTPFFDAYPPETAAHALPQFPAIERDLSVVIDERIPWGTIKETLHTIDLEHVETCSFVTTFRGKPIAPGKKSLTFRLRFRSPDRTLVHEEVDPQMQAVVRALAKAFDAEVRA